MYTTQKIKNKIDSLIFRKSRNNFIRNIKSKKYAINTNEKKKNKSIKFFYKYIIISNIKIKRHIFS